MPEPIWDVCVVGGGPAGALAAFRLSSLGRKVCLVEQETFPRACVGESLSPGIWPLLDSLALSSLISSNAFRPVGDTLLCWAEPQPVRLPFRGNSKGKLVNREDFDPLLLQASVDAGATVVQPARAQAKRGISNWVVTTNTGTRISAKWIVDAAGRRGCVQGKWQHHSPVSVAVWAHLKSRRTSETRVEALPDGWIWAAPVGDDRLSVVMICNPGTVRNTANGGVEAFLRQKLTQSVLLSEFARDDLVRSPVVVDSTVGHSLLPIGPEYIKIGEAAYSLDPLASTGIEKAMQTAVHGAAVVHTLLDHPDRKGACHQFYQQRISEAISGHMAWTGEFYGQVGRYADQPFWSARQSAIPSQVLPRKRETLEVPCLDTRVALGSDVAFVAEPCLYGEQIETLKGVSAFSLDRPVVFIDEIKIAQLLADVRPGTTIGSLLEGWSRTMPRFKARQIAQRLWQWALIVRESGENEYSDENHSKTSGPTGALN